MTHPHAVGGLLTKDSSVPDEELTLYYTQGCDSKLKVRHCCHTPCALLFAPHYCATDTEK